MENEKRKLVIIGSSHATRLFKSCKNNQILQQNFDLLSYTINGGTFLKLKHIIAQALKQPFTSQDVIVFQLFGNDWFKKGLHAKDFKTGIIHLRKFDPAEDKDVEDIYHQFRQLLKETSANVLVIDNPHRHINCCLEHESISRRIAPYFTRRNKELAKFLSEYVVIDHRRLLPEFSMRKLKQTPNYVKILDIDTVHLKEECYDQWSTSIARQLGFNY